MAEEELSNTKSCWENLLIVAVSSQQSAVSSELIDLLTLLKLDKGFVQSGFGVIYLKLFILSSAANETRLDGTIES
jgi:hypothetical protein